MYVINCYFYIHRRTEVNTSRIWLRENRIIHEIFTPRNYYFHWCHNWNTKIVVIIQLNKFINSNNWFIIKIWSYINSRARLTVYSSTMYSRFVLVIFVNVVLCEKYLKFYKDDLEFNRKYLVNAISSLRMKSRNSVNFNIECDLLVNVKNVFAHAVLYKFYNQFRPFLFNDSAVLCDVLKPNSYLGGVQYFGKTVIRIMKRYSNMIQCNHSVRCRWLWKWI